MKGNLTKTAVESYESGNYAANLTYNDDNQVATRQATGFGNAVNETYTYSADDAFHDKKITATKITVGSAQFMNTADTYDSFDRLSSRSRTISGASGAAETYTYTRGRVDSETSFNVASVSYSYGGQSGSESYSYDQDGNIVQTDSAKYTYDLLGRLTREDNERLNKSFAYTYDLGGNITSRKEYAYTTGTLGSALKTANYVYSGDRLTSYDSKTCAYNADGTPTRYKGTSTTFYRGRMAVYGNYYFEYDHNGVRRVKYSNDGMVLVSYCYDGTRLLAEKRMNSPSQIVYFYDHSGIVGLQVDSTKYYYRKDLLGDIVAVYQGNTKVGEYVYDAWGNHRIFTAGGVDITDNSSYNNNVLKLNPFRYRGYYFDAETKLYYLINRYYDPEAGRFLSADDVSYLDPETIGGLNLYAYCNNNPVMNIDPEGNAWWHWVIGAVVLAAAIGLAVVTAGASAAVTAAAAAGIEGTLASSTITLASMSSYAIGAAVSGTAAAIVGTATNGISVKDGKLDWDWESASQGFMWGSITGGIGGAIGANFGAAANGAIAIGMNAGQQLISSGHIDFSQSISAGIFGAVGSKLGISQSISSIYIKNTGALIGDFFRNIGFGLSEWLTETIFG